MSGSGGPANAPVAREDEYARAARPVVIDVARRLAEQLGVEASDLESLGNEALVGLIRRYDPGAAPFEAYLRRFLRWAMLDGLRRASERVAPRAAGLAGCVALREPGVAPADEHAARGALCVALATRACALGVPLVARDGGAELPADSTRAPDRMVAKLARRRALQTALAAMDDERQRTLVVRHYFGDEPLDHIAIELGLTSDQMHRLHKKALIELHAALSTAGVDEP